MQVDLTQRWEEAVWVVAVEGDLIVVGDLEPVVRCLADRQHAYPDTGVLVSQLKPLLADTRNHRVGPGAKHPQGDSLLALVRPEHRVRAGMQAFDHSLQLGRADWQRLLRHGSLSIHTSPSATGSVSCRSIDPSGIGSQDGRLRDSYIDS